MSLIAQIREKSEERKKVLDQAGALLTKASTEKRAFTAEEDASFEQRHKDADAMLKDIERLQKQLTATRSLEDVPGDDGDKRQSGREDRSGDNADDNPEAEKAALKLRNAAIRSYLRGGFDGMSPEQGKVMREMRASLTEDEKRGLVVGTTTAGGYTVAPDTSFYGKLVEAQKQFGLDETMFDVIETGTGAALPIPTLDDTANVDAAHTEATADSAATDLVFGQVSLSAYSRSTGVLKVSIEAMQDSALDVEGLIAKKLGERYARKKAALLTTGTGTGQPTGIVTGSTLGKTAAGAAAVTYNEILDLIHSVDPAYRPTSRLMFHDTTLLILKKLVDSQSRPLFIAGYAEREPDRINGYPFVINQNMATVATGNKSIIFGDFKNFMVRNVKGFKLIRLQERYAEEGVVAFIGWTRYDSKVVNAGQNPIKHLIQA